MKPKFKTTLSHLHQYYHSIGCGEYNLKIFVDGKIWFNNFLSIYHGEYGYCKVLDFYKNPNTKTITMYATDNAELINEAY